MSDQDSFINEVTEEVRKERLFLMLRRYGWIGIAVVLVVVGGAAWNEYRKAQDRAAAQALGDQVLDALEAETPEARAAALGNMTAEGDAAAMLALLAAAQAEDSAQAGTALARLDAVAADPGVDQVYRDLAAIKALLLRGDSLSPEDRISRLIGLSVPGAPYRPLALELTAHAQVDAGQTDDALATLTELLSDADVSQGLRQRASQLIVALGGSLDAS